MPSGGFRFESFVLDPADRRLSRNGAPVELNGRYLDALSLLVREQGKLVSKDRFLDEVWRGVPVTDEALTQCIRTLRRQLGDEAGSPRFIETVPKHGYRFIAAVEMVDEGAAGSMASRRAPSPPPPWTWQPFLLIGGAGTIGGSAAGILGGLFYGLAGASQPFQPGIGAASILLVMLCVGTLIGTLGAAGVAFGIAAADRLAGRVGAWTLLGGAIGGAVVGAAGKMLGLDAFNLLLGRSPGDITGLTEGFMLGGAVGLGTWIASRLPTRSGVGLAAIAGGAAGILITLLGGHLLSGSLNLLAHQFPGSRLHLDPIGALFGEHGFGPLSQAVLAGLEGTLFSGCVVGAIILAQRGRTRSE
jgi:DNA-binding winged helix-turn-helix (wHTH) protein